MANNENLRRLTPSEAREYGRMGGKASGAARRKKADFRKTLNALLTAEIDNPEWTPFLEALGLDSTLEAAVNAAMIREALSGNVKAYLAIKDVLGQTSKSDEDLEEQRIRTDRARRARDQEVGDTDAGNENIQNFLKAMNPTEDDMVELYSDQEAVEDEDDAEEAEETSKV